MNNAHPKISTKASPDAETHARLGADHGRVADAEFAAPEIRQLSETTINRIAAGEVVERPASALKELVENALDAGARRIDIAYADGGKTLIRVMDDGCGMSASDLPLALSRHATSKLNADDLLDIHSFGFRGEALPSLGAVGRLTITSRPRGGTSAHQITVNGSVQGDVRPAAGQFGTLIELRDLFYATPARLKFLRTDRAEASAVLDVVKRLAMAEPFVAFTLRDVSGSAGAEGRLIFRADAENGDLFDALHGRLRAVLGRDFAENALKIDALRDGVHLSGYAALPTYSRGAAVEQFMFVNGRPVRDKVLLGALRAAYFDFLSRDRHPAACLFIDCDPQWVDVNVHPAKSEVRFREPALVRGLIVSGLRAALAEAGHRASTTVSNATLGAFRAETAPHAGLNAGPDAPRFQMPLGGTGGYAPRTATPQFSEQAGAFAGWDAPSSGLMDAGDMASARVDAPVAAPDVQALPLGAARAQVHENYIISQTENGIVIVDAHAAHERLVYERLKAQMAANTLRAQALLIPEIVDLSAGDCAMLIEAAPGLERLGLTIEPFGGTAIAVRETPAILGQVNARALILDIVDELSDLGVSTGLETRLEAVLSRVACHGSVRTGRHLRVEEMNALLREMEATPHSGQCNHGRPTYVSLKLTDIERLFGRS